MSDSSNRAPGVTLEPAARSWRVGTGIRESVLGYEGTSVCSLAPVWGQWLAATRPVVVPVLVLWWQLP